MKDNIRQILFQMLVLAQYSGDKEKFIESFLRKCEKTMLPVYATRDDYYMHLHKATLKGMTEFIQKVAPTLRPQQVRNLHLLTKSILQ